MWNSISAVPNEWSEGSTEVPVFFNNASKFNPTYRKGTMVIKNSAFPQFSVIEKAQKQIKWSEEFKYNHERIDSFENIEDQPISKVIVEIGSCEFTL